MPQASNSYNSGWTDVKGGMFSNVSGWQPNAANFEYGGRGEGSFGMEGRGARDRQANLSELGQTYKDVKGLDTRALVQAQQDSNMRQSLALARSGRGGAAGQAAALNAAQQQQAAGNAQVNAQALQGRMAQLGMQGQLGQQLAGARLQQTGMNDQFSLGMYGMGQKSSLAQLQANMGYEQLLSQNMMQAQLANAQLAGAREAAMMGAGGALLSSFGVSDPRAKEDVRYVSSPGYTKTDIAPAGYGTTYGDAAAYTTGYGGGLGSGAGYSASGAYAPPPRYDAVTQATQYSTGGGSGLGGGAGYQMSGGGAAAGEAAAEQAATQQKEKGRAAFLDLMTSGYKNMNINPHAADTYRAPQFVDMSDPRAKQDVYVTSGLEAKRDVQQSALQAAMPRAPSPTDAAAELGSYSYRYKPEFAAQEGEDPRTRHVGPMANGGPDSMEANPVYAPAVKRGPDGMARVDTGRATMENIAVTSDNSRRIKDLEAELAASRVSGQVMSPNEQLDAEDRILVEPRLRENTRAMSPHERRQFRRFEELFREFERPVSPSRGSLSSELDQVQRDATGAMRRAGEPDRKGALEAAVVAQNQPTRRVDARLPDSQKYRPIDPLAHKLPAHESSSTKDYDQEREIRMRYKLKPGDKVDLGPWRGDTPRAALDRGLDGRLQFNPVDPAIRRFGDTGEHEDYSGVLRTKQLDQRLDTFQMTPEELRRSVVDQPTVEDVVGQAAADIASSSNKKVRRAQITNVRNALQGGRVAKPSPNLVYRQLQQRGIKISKDEVEDALRKEYEL